MDGSTPKILVLNGPSLSALGTREPEIYGRTTLREIEETLISRAREMGVQASCRQSNHEGELIDWILEARDQGFSGIVINPAAYTHTSLALADALKASGVPAVEVHISNIHARESIRRVSLTGGSCLGSICGLGPAGYVLALTHLVALVEGKDSL